MDDPPGVEVSPAYESVTATAIELLSGAGGGALCVYQDGRPALDVWAGHADPGARTEWARHTMAMSWSTTKGVASTAVHMLADRELLRYDDPVTTYWPEFGANGKQDTTIRHVLSMQAGLYPIRPLIADPRDMLDHDTMAAALAAAAPVHEPGARSGYHAFTYGWLVGEIVRRVAGITIGQFVRDEIAEPLGLDGCYIGTPADELDRVAARPDLKPERRLARGIAKTLHPITVPLGLNLRRIAAAFLPRGGNEVIPTVDFLRAEVPGVNGVFTARSLARMYAALGSDDGVDGVHLWSERTRRAASEQQTSRRDEVLPIKVDWQLGFHRPFPHRKTAAGAFGFFGAYGSGAFADPSRRLAVALTVQQAKGFPLVKLMPTILAAADERR